MPAWFVIALILWFIAALAAGAALFRPYERVPIIAGAVLVAVLGVICSIIASYDRVDTRNVGIITAFGKPVGTAGAGIVWHAPWKKVYELSEAIQLQAFESGSYDDASKGTGSNGNPPAQLVRLANLTNAYVDININWRLKEGAAGKLFQDYGGSNTDVFGQIKNNLVDRQAQTILSHEFASFNPQATVPVTPGDPTTQQVLVVPDLPGYSAKVKHDLQEAVGAEIEILDVKIPRIFYDPGTQGRIDDFNKKVQETKNAQQDIQTANARKAANDIIASSVQNPMVVVAQCVDQRIKASQDPGPCWGPLGGIGGKDGVLINMPKP